MTPAAPRLARLLKSLHRRGTVLHVLEHGGIGLAAGAAIGLLLTLLLWSDARPALPAAMLAMAGGTIIGCAWGVWRRPSALGSAIRADRQLATDDLLASAATLAATAGHDPWANAVLVMAEQRSRELSPSAVMLRRLSSREWGGIGLSSAVAMTVALLAGVNDASQPESAAIDRRATTAGERETARPMVALAPDSPLLPSPMHQEPAGDPGEKSSTADALTTKPASDPVAAADASTNNASASTEGSGGGLSKTTRPSGAAAAASPAGVDGPPSHPSKPASSAAKPAGGIAGAASAGDDGVSGMTGASGPSVKGATPPWKSPAWADSARDASRQLHAGQVPAAYRDLVRQFFELEQ